MTASLIGREHPAALLRAEVGRAMQSHGGLVLVTGEAGIGKTTLVAGAVEEARRLGALVLGGSCWDSANAPGYWPWVQVVRGLRRAVSAEQWARAAPGALSILLGESPNTEATGGFELYDAVTTALVTVSQERPVVVALDDLHWADTASLKLLEFAARHTWFERLLLIGTYRDAEVETAGHPLQPLITPLLGTATTLTLTGLSCTEVGALIARTAGDQPEPSVVAEVHRRTGGNPFFVEQAARLWRGGSAIDAIAPGVRDAVQRRLTTLPTAVRTALTGAAVLGREFHRQVLAATIAVPVAELSRLLDQAAAARLVTSLGGGRFSFAHDLVRESLYQTLDEETAHAKHAAVVNALDRHPELTERVPPAELARHAYLAGADIAPSRAVDQLISAARDAGSRLAAEEGVEHLRRAYELASYDPKRRVVVALDLGRDLQHLSQRAAAWQLFDEAVTQARALDDPELLARVGLTLYRADPEDPEVMRALLRDAHAKLVRSSTSDSPLSTGELAEQLTERLMVSARNVEDDDALSFGLWARHDTLWGPGTAKERAALTDEITAVARRTGDYEAEFMAVSLKWVALLEQGDPRYLDQYNTFVAMVARAERPSAAFASSIDQQIICGLLGRFDDSEAFLARAMEFAPDHQHFDYMELQLRWSMLLLQGRFDELAEVHRALAKTEHPHPALLEAITAAQRGDLPRIQKLADAVAAGEPYPRFFLPLWLRYRAQVAALRADPEECARVRELVAPLEGEWLVSMYGCDISGPAEFWLGLLDFAQRRWNDAVQRFTTAVASAERLGARPWVVEGRVTLAEALRARALGNDAARASTLLAEARREAAELDMRHLITRLSEVDEPRTEPAASGCEFRRDGSMWTLGFEGTTVHMADTKGLRDLHALLSQPGTDISAVELLDPSGGAVVVAARQFGGDALLDEAAKSAYQRRLAELDEQIEEAVHGGADTRAAKLDAERAALLEELRAAAGLGGRTRRLGDEAERARKTVTARIRDTLRKLDAQHPSLAAHLRSAVTTGSNCRYQPERGPHWRL